MTTDIEYQPFAGIIDQALVERRNGRADMTLDPNLRVPGYWYGCASGWPTRSLTGATPA